MTSLTILAAVLIPRALILTLKTFLFVCARSSWNALLCSHPDAPGMPNFYKDHCSNSTAIICTPTQDEFNPCEDIMSAVPLRILIWIISILALLGNAAVLLVLLGMNMNNQIVRFMKPFCVECNLSIIFPFYAT